VHRSQASRDDSPCRVRLRNQVPAVLRDTCLCAPAEDVAELYARELETVEDCSCTDRCVRRWSAPEERLYRTALEALVRGLRTGVRVVGAPARAPEVRAPVSRELALAGLLEAYRRRGDVAGAELCERDLARLRERSVAGGVTALQTWVPQLSGPQVSLCCRVEPAGWGPVGVERRHGDGVVATLSCVGPEGVVVVRAEM
jgi:hypothetical protein